LSVRKGQALAHDYLIIVMNGHRGRKWAWSLIDNKGETGGCLAFVQEGLN